MAGGLGQDDEWTARFKADQDLHWKALLRHYRLKKPLIAAVEGTAVAGGTEILQGTDIRIAGASAKFGVAEARWGLFPLGGSTVRLRRQIPYTLAMEHPAHGPPHHRRGGAAHRPHRPRRPRRPGARRGDAASPSRSPPTGRSRCRRSSAPCIETEGLPEKEALAKELEIGWPIFATEDAKEGPRAFMEKRKPDFKGK